MARWGAMLDSLIAASFLAACAATAADAQSGTIYYTYDALGRVLTAYYPDLTCLAYSYDAAGNRTQYASSTVQSPVANPVSAGTWQDVASTFDPRVNDPVCGTLTVAAVGTPSHGAASIVSGGAAVIYTPNAGYVGSDSFTYQVSNGHTTSANGTISMTVQAPTLPPVALGGAATAPPPTQWAPIQPGVTLDISNLISDPYGYPVTLTSATNGAKGTVTPSGTTLTYVYNFTVNTEKQISDNFTYTVSDGHGHTATASVAVTIFVSSSQ